ncbi:MAG: fibronectin type III domain-containing protein [Nitrosomonas sp.]|nr:MAG: fibronectin type III domain-containing protein [Nitrosomonas sp.]
MTLSRFFVRGTSAAAQSGGSRFLQDRVTVKHYKNAAIAALLIFFSGATSLSHAANLLFKSNFGTGVSLGPVYDFVGNYARQDVIGTDEETGHSWPIKAFGSKWSGIHLMASEPIDAANVNDHIVNIIRPVIGPSGTTINELFQNVKIKSPVGSSGAYASLQVVRPYDIGDIDEAYIAYWFKYEADFPEKLDHTVNNGSWRAQFGWKTGGYNNNTSTGDYRFSVHVMKGPDGELFWRTAGDNIANGPWDKTTYWNIDNKTVAVPVDKWFKFEVYWKRSSGNDGRFWVAVDGQEIADRFGPNMGDYGLPVTRVTFNTPYSGGYPTVESHSTGLEIWDGFPCGNGTPCFSAVDTVPPTVPTSLTTSNLVVSLSWNASSDAGWGVLGYRVFRNGTVIGASSVTSFTDTISGGATGTKYNYTVRAFDGAGNVSQESNVISITY